MRVTNDPIITCLKSRSPLEILELIGLDENPEMLVESLLEYIDDSLEYITQQMKQNGLLDEDEEGFSTIRELRAQRPGDGVYVSATVWWVTPEGVVTWCRANMANYKVPRRVEIVSEFPMNATGKVLKYELRRRVELGLPLWHNNDRHDYSGLTGAVRPRD